MTLSHGKLLELKSITKSSHKIFLQVRLFFEKDIDTYLEIDEFTSANINAIINGDENYKYRLSFSSYFDPIKQQHISSLTKTYLEDSSKVCFSCSEDYLNNLNSIRKIQDISDLDNLSFISKDFHNLSLVSKDLESTDEEETPEKLAIDLEPENNINKSLNLSYIGFSLIFIMFLIFLITSFLNQNAINEKVLADSIQLDKEIRTHEDQSLDLLDKQVVIQQNENLGIEDTLLFNNIILNQSTLPFIALNDTITYSIPKGNVALTFDDGPSQYSREIVDILKEYEVGATFFLVGKNVKRHPEYVKYIHSNGYSIGSHSMNHPGMNKLSYEKQKSEVIESIQLIEDITNEEAKLFRPPYGAFNEQLKNILQENNYKMALWDNDPEDWKSQNSEKILKHIQNTDVSGSIILLHESQAVMDALPRIIEYLQQMDLEIVNLR